MISLDTNILASYYVDAGPDTEAAKQRPLALGIMESQQRLFVTRSVALEFAWLLTAVYGFGARDVCRVVDHLLGQGVLPGLKTPRLPEDCVTP